MNELDNQNTRNNKKSNKGTTILLIILGLIIVALGAYLILFEGKNKPREEKEINTTVKAVANEYRMKGNSLEDFDLSFLKLNNSGEDIVYSPLSIKYALAMLYEASSGDAQKQIGDLIGDYTAKKYNNSEHISLANAMFIKDTYKEFVKQTYIDNLKNKYNAEVIIDGFDSSSTINSWVNNKTLKLIDNIITDDSLKILDFVLVNALAIDMKWVYQIQEAPNEDQDSKAIHFNSFYRHELCESVQNCSWFLSQYSYGTSRMDFDGQEVDGAEIAASVNKYDIINIEGKESIKEELINAYEEHKKEDENFSYTDEDIETYINELSENYGKIEYSTDFYFNVTEDEKVFAKDLREYDGTTLEYVGIMPKNDDLLTYVEEINASKINELLDGLKDASDKDNYKEGVVTRITGHIPMFNNNYELDLIDNLKSLGINNIFKKGKANLTNMVSNASDEFIADAKHKTNIQFTNEGIKAAAVTIEGGLGSASDGYYFDVPVEIIDLNFDKPYIYIIRDKQTGEVWFAGSVYNPTPITNEINE